MSDPSLWPSVALCFAFLAVVGWALAVHWYSTARRWEARYQRERRRQLSEAGTAVLVGAASEAVSQVARVLR